MIGKNDCRKLYLSIKFNWMFAKAFLFKIIWMLWKLYTKRPIILLSKIFKWLNRSMDKNNFVTKLNFGKKSTRNFTHFYSIFVGRIKTDAFVFGLHSYFISNICFWTFWNNVCSSKRLNIQIIIYYLFFYLRNIRYKWNVFYEFKNLLKPIR